MRGYNVAELGGLHIIGSERHEARRIDNQLRGRSGRQGDPGSSRFFLSLEDDLMRIFAKDWVKNMLDKLGGWEPGMAIESRMVTKGIANAQRKVEEHNFEIRKNLLEYDEAMNEQRKIIYQQRQQVLEGEDLKQMVINMIKNQISLGVERNFDKGMVKNEIRDAVDRHVGGRKIEDLDLEAEEADIPEGDKQLSDLEIENILLWAQDEFGVELPVEEFQDASLDQIKDAVVEAAAEAHDGLKNLLAWIKSQFGVTVSPTNLKNLPPEEIEEKLI